MKKEIITLSIMRFAVVAFVIILFLIFTSAVVAVESDSFGLMIGFGIASLLIGIVIAHLFARTKTRVDLSHSEYLIINDDKIPYSDIAHCVLDSKGISTSGVRLAVLGSTKNVKVYGPVFGKNGYQFDEFKNTLIDCLDQFAPHVEVKEIGFS